jgi:bacterioferritin (cytochrome b1)
MLDLIAATRLTPNVERSAAYMRHMLDEARHARMFAARSAELRLQDDLPSLGYPVADIEDLFESLGELRFLAFVHTGEKRGRKQFETYRDWFEKRGDHKSGAMFAAIVRDEERHERYTYDLLVAMAGGELQAQSELRAVAAWEVWRTWRRMGRFLAEKLYFIAMLLIYALWGPVMAMFGLMARTSKRVPAGSLAAELPCLSEHVGAPMKGDR